MRPTISIRGLLLAGGAIALLAFASNALAEGSIVDAVVPTSPDDMIPGIRFDPEQPHTEYRARIKGTGTLPYGRGTFAYDMPVWIVTPADTSVPTTAIVDPLHTVNLRNGTVAPDGMDGEQPRGLFALLGSQFLFRSGRNYTWVAVRWDRAALDPDPIKVKLRYDHRYADAHGVDPGTIDSPRENPFGAVIIADLADALRSGIFTMRGPDTAPQPFANVQRVAVIGTSQTSNLETLNLFDPLGPAIGAEAHHVPLFDLWLIGGSGGTVQRWPGSSISEIPSPTPESSGVVIWVGHEQDVGPEGAYDVGNEWLRFSGLSHWNSYEVAGAAHIQFSQRTFRNTVLLAPDGTTVLGGPIFLPDLDDPVLESAGIIEAQTSFFDFGGVQRDLTDYFADPAAAGVDAMGLPLLSTTGVPLYRNPLNTAPFTRALFAAGEARVRDGTPLPENAWLLPADGSLPVNGAIRPIPVDEAGLPQFLQDSVGNTLGGLRHPFVNAGRGRFYARHPRCPFNLNGSYVDRGFLPVPPFRKHSAFVIAVALQADKLVAARYLLQEDADRLTSMAAHSLEGMPATSAKPAPEPTTSFDGEEEGALDDIP